MKKKKISELNRKPQREREKNHQTFFFALIGAR